MKLASGRIAASVHDLSRDRAAPLQAPAVAAVAPGIFSVQLLDARYCSSTVERLKDVSSWHAARVSAAKPGARGAVRKQLRSAWILSSKERGQLYSEVEYKVRTVVQPVVSSFWGIDLYGCAGTQLIRYGVGDRYVPHRDSCEDPRDLSCSSRYFTVVCYLNDDFDGGRTSFPGLAYTAGPVPGRALLFPSSYLHAAKPITRGEKYVIVTWLYGPVPLRWI